MRWLAMLVFVALIALGDLWIEHNNRAPGLMPVTVAARDLPAGTLVQASDLAPGPPSGGYVTAPVKKGQPVGALAAQVTLEPPAQGDVILAEPAARDLVAAGRINAGARATACSAGKAVTTSPLWVRAVICPNAGACTAMVETPGTNASAFAAPAAPGQIAVVPLGGANPCG
jgi:hypothetical protein